MAPERVLVFEVRGAIRAFADCVRRVQGLELIDEEELEWNEEDKAPVAYLMVSDAQALGNILSLWRRWRDGKLVSGETPWRDVFGLLRDLRTWGPKDRVDGSDSDFLAEEIEGRTDDQLVKLEIELVFRANDDAAMLQERAVIRAVAIQGGQLLSRSRIAEIAYHALLVELPVRAVRAILQHAANGVAGLDPVMHIRPQSIATSIEVADVAAPDREIPLLPLGEPILALLDGVPVAQHQLLGQRVVVDDLFALEPTTPVADRVHGTAMASLILHGDRNRSEPALPRRIHVVPVLGAGDSFPNDRLIVDLIYNAVLAMRNGGEPTAPNVLIVNLSLGNRRRSFYGSLSPWARLIDRLAHHYGLLFLVSAGNNIEKFAIRQFARGIDFEGAAGPERSRGTLQAISDVMGQRRLLAPAETVNGVTVGACNCDAVSPADRRTARVNVDPYPDLTMTNPSSALGPGFAAAVKPDILMPGGREHLRVVGNHSHIDVVPAQAARSAGLKVAAPPRSGRENLEHFTGGTSAAAALASRTCHRIHDALEAAYGNAFRALPQNQRAVLLKALLVHPARWPDAAADLIRTTIGPPEGKYHSRQKDNIRRFLGHGLVDADDAVACAEDRATFWAVGTLERDKVADIAVPVPQAFRGQARLHALSATLAWFTPVQPGRKSYRSVRLKILEPTEYLRDLAVKPHSNQPDGNQTARGTVFTRCWSGSAAPVISDSMSIALRIQRDPDQGAVIDESIPFGMAVTLAMPGVIGIYEQVRQHQLVKPPLAVHERVVS